MGKDALNKESQSAAQELVDAGLDLSAAGGLGMAAAFVRHELYKIERAADQAWSDSLRGAGTLADYSDLVHDAGEKVQEIASLQMNAAAMRHEALTSIVDAMEALKGVGDAEVAS